MSKEISIFALLEWSVTTHFRFSRHNKNFQLLLEKENIDKNIHLTSISTASLLESDGWNQLKTVLGSMLSSRSSTKSLKIIPCSPVRWAVTHSQPSPMSLWTKNMSPFWKLKQVSNLLLLFHLSLEKSGMIKNKTTYVSSSVSGILVYGRIATTLFLSLTGSGGGTGWRRRSLFSKSEQLV